MRERIYIAGKITGNLRYMEDFERAERDLKAAGYAPANPAAATRQLAESGGGWTHDEYMSITREILDGCNGIYLLKGWRESMGAREEFMYILERSKFDLNECKILFEGELNNFEGE